MISNMSSKTMQATSSNNTLFERHLADKMDNLKYTTTENGADALTNYGLTTDSKTPSYIAPLVALSNELVRANESKKPIKKGVMRNDYQGITRKRVAELIYEVFLEIKKYKFTPTNRSITSKKILGDLVKIMFNIRDIRGTYGKGERRIFLWMIVEINRYLPDLVYWLLTFIPHYGSYKDLADLYELVHIDETSGENSITPDKLFWPSCDKMYKKLNIKTSIVELFAYALEKDLKQFSRKDESEISISLAARWVPKEGRALAKITRSDPKGSITKRIANKLYPLEKDTKSLMAKFRRHVSKLNKHLDTVQIKMSSNKFSDIEFKKVPGRAIVKFQKAWKGVDKKGHFIHSSNKDRTKCYENYMSFLNDLKSGKTDAKGKQLHIHELVNKMENGLKPDEIDLYNAQFKSHIDDIIKYQKDNGKVVPPYVPMADVSGSMSGDPMSVSIGMAIICSHPGIAHPTWENIVLPFSSNPTLVRLRYPNTLVEWQSSKSSTMSYSIYSSSHVLGNNFDPKQAGRELTPYEKVRVLMCMDWGCSTNFTGAFALLADLAIRTGTKMPNCLVISDMQFDSASSYNTFNSKYKDYSCSEIFSDMGSSTDKPLIKQLNKHLSTKPCGACNTCVFWNVRGGTKNHPCGADDKGVIEISGFSSNMIKLFFYEGKLESPTSKSGDTSWEYLRTMIDCEDYNQLESFVDIYCDAENELTKMYDDVEFTPSTEGTRYLPVLTFLLRCIIRNRDSVPFNKSMQRIFAIAPSTWAKDKYIKKISIENSHNIVMNPFRPEFDAHVVKTSMTETSVTETSVVDYSKIDSNMDDSLLETSFLKKPKLIRQTAKGKLDIPSLLSVIEQSITGKTLSDITVIQRINKLENIIFGSNQSGSICERVDNLHRQISG